MVIGDFEYLTDYIYYDMPLLYTLKHNSGIVVLVYWYTPSEYIDENNYTYDQYLYMLTTLDEIEILESKQMSLNNFFSIKANANQMFLVTHDENYYNVDLFTMQPFTDIDVNELWETEVYLVE